MLLVNRSPCKLEGIMKIDEASLAEAIRAYEDRVPMAELARILDVSSAGFVEGF